MQKLTQIVLASLIIGVSTLVPSTAQDGSHGVQLTLRDAGGQGDLIFLIGDGLRRDAATGAVRMTGGVQVQQGGDLLLLADEIQARLTDQATNQHNLDQVNQLDVLELKGQVFIRAGAIIAEGELVRVNLNAQRISLPIGPSRLKLDTQSLQILGTAKVDVGRGILQADGGVTLRQGDMWLEVERLQLRRAPDAPAGTPVEVLAEGGIRAQGPDFWFEAGRIESSADGRRLYMSGGVTFVGAAGSLNAGRMTYDLESQAFSMDRTSTAPIRGLGFINL